MAYSTKVRYADPAKPLKNPRWEALANQLSAGEKQGKAAILAGFKPSSAAALAVKLVKNPLVKARVEYLKCQSSKIAIERVGLNKGEILWKLQEIATLAIEAGDLSAANRALELIGKQLGMFVERKVIGIQALIAELTPDNLRLAKPDDLLRLVESVDSALLALPESTEESTG